MNVYRFINSKDIAKHLREVNYSFSSQETAWLIWQSHTASMAERHEAWMELINTMPDCEITTKEHRTHWDSLHQMLKDYMALEEKLKTILQEEDPGAAYVLDEYGPVLDGERSDWYGDHLFKDFSGALRCAAEREEDMPYRIRKRWFGTPYSITGYYSEGNALLRMDSSLPPATLSEPEDILWAESFFEMCFDFPIPFQRGDLVQDSVTKEPFVLLETDSWRRQNSRKAPSRDMYAFGYSYDEKERFLWDNYMANYMDLEYCTEPLKGSKRILEAYSRYEKGEIDAWTLLRFFRMYESEEAAEIEYRHIKRSGAVI